VKENKIYYILIISCKYNLFGDDDDGDDGGGGGSDNDGAVS